MTRTVTGPLTTLHATHGLQMNITHRLADQQADESAPIGSYGVSDERGVEEEPISGYGAELPSYEGRRRRF